MGVPKVTEKISRSIITENTIPDYAMNYRKEYFLLRVIDKTCEKFVKTIKKNKEFYNSYKAIIIISKIKEFKRLGYFNNKRLGN